MSRMPIVLITVALLAVACDAVAELSPAVFLLEKDAVKLYLFGTVHDLSAEQYNSLRHMPDYVGSALAQSDVVFVETLPPADRAEVAAVRLVLMGGVGRPSVRKLIDGWESDRRERFVQALGGFPGVRQAGGHEALLSMRPFAAQAYISSIMNVVAGFDAARSVDEWVQVQAGEGGADILALEDSRDLWALYDDLGQDRYLAELEDMVLLQPSFDRVEDARRKQLEDSFQKWAAGNVGFGRDFLLATLLGAEPDSLGFQVYEDHARVSFDIRQERWISVISETSQRLGDSDSTPTIFVAVGLAHLSELLGDFVGDLTQSGWVVVDQWPAP